MYGQGGLKLETKIPLQQIFARSKEGGLIIEGSIFSSEYGKCTIPGLQTTTSYIYTLST